MYVRSMTDTVGRWSVRAGRMVGLTLHEMNEEGESVFLQTLSGRVQFPELCASRVGMSRGSAISSRMFTMRSSSGFSSLSWLVRWSLCVASHVRWCRLKSPRTIISVAGFSVHSSSCVSHSFAIVSMLWLWPLSLYMLTRSRVRAFVVILMAVMSLDWILICWTCADCMLVFTKIMDRILFWFSRFLLDGYITFQCIFARVSPIESR